MFPRLITLTLTPDTAWLCLLLCTLCPSQALHLPVTSDLPTVSLTSNLALPQDLCPCHSVCLRGIGTACFLLSFRLLSLSPSRQGLHWLGIYTPSLSTSLRSLLPKHLFQCAHRVFCLFIVHCLSPPGNCKLHVGRNFYLSCPLLCLEWFLKHNEYSYYYTY